MGVHKLWDLLTATALPVRVESLFGKVCCIDASFWIIHCMASESINRHGGDVIAVFFLRICYLLDKGIRPVFVFDGKSPFAKIKTIIKRKMINNKYSTNHKLLAFKMLVAQLESTNRQMNLNRVAYPMPQTYSIEPSEETNSSEQTEECQHSSDVDLFELFPEDFLNKTDEEEFDRELKMLKECDFLTSKSKYELMNAVRDRIIQKDRDESLKLKGKIDEYSNHQIQSYLTDVKINNEIEQLKNELYQRYPQSQQRVESLNFRNALNDEICNYNEYFATNFENNFIALRGDYEEGNEAKFDEYIKEEPMKSHTEEIDDSVFATDDQIFGTELMSGMENIEGKRSLKQESKEDIESQNNLNSSEKGGNTQKQVHHTDSITRRDYTDNLKQQSLSDNEEQHQLSSGIDQKQPPSYNDQKQPSSYNDQKQPTSDNDQQRQPSDDERSSSDDEDEVFVAKKPENIIQPEYTDKIKLTQNKMYYDDTQALLELFGVPYLIAPSEAESQCAYMNKKGDCYAVISDDSDALVFGARCLLKNFYNDNVFELYTAERIRKELGIGRKQLALIAVICGCDYTNGVRGIGVVNALEVIKAYPKFEDLHEFKHWATSDCSVESATSDECQLRSEYKKAHINYRVHWTFSSDFPNREAYDLFLRPTTTDEYHLSWKKPDFKPLLEFMLKRSSLPQEQVKQCLDLLYVRRSQQFIMEDVVPDIAAKPFVKKALAKYRRSLNTNLSAFRRMLSNIKSRSRFNIGTKLLIDRSHTLSKIRSKRMLESIKSIRKRNVNVKRI
ncbi:uncharacterized protein TOT_040000390 [Theileria orientalis strain Shintoku]|uniref:DNA repair protein n=1 Tax=Theileria orientalis strain Shintoku TaxID=869250 RepID=J4DQ85_THEOR|nr:uncharacterized protein TOT_040000390 [Theileria orientalis strain Shintoku]BAM42014.1 uncharacterized protein TOT_040000390 [Theileria orientalis strain Shintoku]|eukprot:XP_009692315.1 uncharacterized protein TOT_040000390 [Theileria orientalis strain Shintoku]